jgi:hypothetical protein
VPGFSLPRGWYRAKAEQIVDDLVPTLGALTGETAWMYLYASVAWFEERANGSYLHLNDRLKTKSGQMQAKRGEQYLTSAITSSKPLTEVIDQFGRHYQAERDLQGIKAGWQRNNITGNSFEATLQVLIHRINDVWPSRTPPLNSLRGFELAPVGYHSKPDLVLFTATDFRLLISTKWTLRKERLGTYLHEAYFYKQRRPDVQVAFVVSEFNINILDWLAHDPLVDRVYHINLPMLLHVHRPFPGIPDGGTIPLTNLLNAGNDRDQYARWLRLSRRLFDLSSLFEDIETLKRGTGAITVDPDAEGGEEDEDAEDDKV